MSANIASALTGSCTAIAVAMCSWQRIFSVRFSALKRRGSLTIWFDPAMTWEAAPTGKRGRQPDYSDAAILACLTMKVLFGMALRQTTGFVESLLDLIDLD